MPHRGFADLLHERMRGVERGRRALGDIGDLRAAQLAALIWANGTDVHIAEDDVAPDDVAVAAGVTHGGATDGRLAGAGFADQADHLPASQLQGHVIDQNWSLASIRAHRNAHAANVEDDRTML